MFIINLKFSLARIVALLIAVTALFIATVAISLERFENKAVSATITEGFSAYDYICSFGPTVDQSGLMTDEIVVPKNFNDVYNSYNEIQKSQGFDLAKYKGCTLVRYTYPVTDYPDKEQTVFAEILTYNDIVVGADIYSTSVDGFISALK